MILHPPYQNRKLGLETLVPHCEEFSNFHQLENSSGTLFSNQKWSISTFLVLL